MEYRKCRVCGEIKPITDFYKHGGRYAHACKECEKTYSKNYMKRYRREHPNCRKEERRKYYLSHKEELAEKQKRSRINYPEKMQAQSKVNYLIHIGEWTKPTACEVCGKEGRVEAHHDDYSKPLEVVWCCKSCHWKLDEERREKERA